MTSDATDPADDDDDPLDILAEEFTARWRRGECPSIDEYADRHPEMADRIRRLFEPIVMIEQLGAAESRERTASLNRAAFKAQIPRQLGDYEIVDEVGRGGMGIVYEAVQQSLGRRVAVKLLARQALVNPRHLQRFHREARTAASLHHSNIVPVFGVGEHDGYHYYVMQFIQGVGLDEVIAQLRGFVAATDSSLGKDGDNTTQCDTENAVRTATVTKVASALRNTEFLETSPSVAEGVITPLQHELNASPSDPIAIGFGQEYWRNVARLGAKVADALQYAHSQNVLHRDIKPGNLLLGTDGEVWVADFGLAKAFEHDDVSQTGDIVGTLRYMAPEQFAGQSDHRSDIYSLGLTLYEAATLQAAHADTNRIHSSGSDRSEILNLRSANSGVPRDLETIVLKACATAPADRYQSASALVDDLNRFLCDLPIHARRASSLERFGRWCRRNPAIAGLSGATALLLVLVAVATSVGYVQTNAALDREEQQRKQADTERKQADNQRQKAERILTISLEALEKVYVRFAPDRISDQMQLTVESDGESEYAVSSEPVLSNETAELLEDVLDFYHRFANEDMENLTLRAEAAKATRRVADIQQRLGAYSQAESSYQLAIKQYRQLLAEHNDNGTYAIEIARLNNALGTVYRACHRPEAADAAHNAAREMLEELPGSDRPVGDLGFELARTFYLLSRRRPPAPGPRPGDAPPRTRDPARRGHRDQKPPPDVRPDRRPERRDRHRSGHLDRAIELMTAGDSSLMNRPDGRCLLALCYRARSHAGRPEDLSTAVNILESLTKQFPNVAEYRYQLSQSLASGDMEMNFERRVTESNFRKAREHGAILVERNPNIPEYAHSLARITQDLGVGLRRAAAMEDSILERDIRLTESEVLCRDALRLQTELIQQFPEATSYRLWHAKLQESLAKTLCETKKFAEAEELMRNSLTSLDAIPPDTSTDWFVEHAIRVHSRTLGRIIELSGQRRRRPQER